MAEKMVRCVRCHEVFDAEEGPCPKCGAPYQPPAAAPEVYTGLYSDRYASQEPVVADPAALAGRSPASRRSPSVLLIGSGAVLIVAAVLVASLVALGALGSPNPTARPFVVSAASRPSATPTLPPTIGMTLAQLNDPKLSAQISITSQVQLNSSVAGQNYAAVTFTGQVSNGNESGTIQSAGVTREFRLVDGQVYMRTLPSGQWSISPSMPSYLVICPVFGITSTASIGLVGQDMKDGQLLNHLRTTRSWRPNLSRMAMEDLGGLPYQPDAPVLDLWATADGTPVTAAFSAVSQATDGTKLVDIEVSYTFSAVGVPATIVAPLPSASPSAS